MIRPLERGTPRDRPGGAKAFCPISPEQATNRRSGAPSRPSGHRVGGDSLGSDGLGSDGLGSGSLGSLAFAGAIAG